MVVVAVAANVDVVQCVVQLEDWCVCVCMCKSLDNLY